MHKNSNRSDFFSWLNSVFSAVLVGFEGWKFGKITICKGLKQATAQFSGGCRGLRGFSPLFCRKRPRLPPYGRGSPPTSEGGGMCWAGGQMAGVRYGSGHAGHTRAEVMWGGRMTRGAHRHTSLYSFLLRGCGGAVRSPRMQKRPTHRVPVAETKQYYLKGL